MSKEEKLRNFADGVRKQSERYGLPTVSKKKESTKDKKK